MRLSLFLLVVRFACHCSTKFKNRAPASVLQLLFYRLERLSQGNSYRFFRNLSRIFIERLALLIIVAIVVCSRLNLSISAK